MQRNKKGPQKTIQNKKPKEYVPREVTVLSGYKKLQFQKSVKSLKAAKEQKLQAQTEKSIQEHENLQSIMKKIKKIRQIDTKKTITEEATPTSDQFRSNFTTSPNSTVPAKKVSTFRKHPSLHYKGLLLNLDPKTPKASYKAHFTYPPTKLKKRLQIAIQKKSKPMLTGAEMAAMSDRDLERTFIQEKTLDSNLLLLESEFNVNLAGNNNNTLDNESLDSDMADIGEDANNGVQFKEFSWKTKPDRVLLKTKGRMLEGSQRQNLFRDFEIGSYGRFDIGARGDKVINGDKEIWNILGSYVDYVLMDPMEKGEREHRLVVVEHLVNHVLVSYDVDPKVSFDRKNNKEQIGLGEGEEIPNEIQEEEGSGSEQDEEGSDEEYQNRNLDDEEFDPKTEDPSNINKNKGFTAGRVLILTPYKIDCYNLVGVIIEMIESLNKARGRKTPKIHQLDKFTEEFSGEETAFEDNFRIGIS